jgi:hypothetical protein
LKETYPNRGFSAPFAKDASCWISAPALSLNVAGLGLESDYV